MTQSYDTLIGVTISQAGRSIQEIISLMPKASHFSHLIVYFNGFNLFQESFISKVKEYVQRYAKRWERLSTVWDSIVNCRKMYITSTRCRTLARSSSASSTLQHHVVRNMSWLEDFWRSWLRPGELLTYELRHSENQRNILGTFFVLSFKTKERGAKPRYFVYIEERAW